MRVGRIVVLVGGLGIVLGAAAAAGADDSRRELLSRSTSGGLALSLLLLGVAIWHFRTWGIGKLVAVGLLAAGGGLVTLADFGDGTPLWSQGHTGAALVARWVMVVSAAVAVAGVLWSFVELASSRGPRPENVTVAVAWWRKWWMLVVGAVVAAWVIGQVYALVVDDGGSTADGPAEDADEGGEGPAVDDEWSITADGDQAGCYIFQLVKTFSAVEEADVEAVGGRLVWPEAEVALCDVGIKGAGEGFVQIGIVSPTTEGCPGMLSAFVDFGVPQTGCLSVRSDGIDDEFCAPLAVK